jgi:hypothetical protein
MRSPYFQVSCDALLAIDRSCVDFLVSSILAIADIMQMLRPVITIHHRRYPISFLVSYYLLFYVLYLSQGLGSLLYRLMLSHLYSPEVLAEADRARRRKKVDDARDNGLLIHRETQVRIDPHAQSLCVSLRSV